MTALNADELNLTEGIKIPNMSNMKKHKIDKGIVRMTTNYKYYNLQDDSSLQWESTTIDDISGSRKSIRSDQVFEFNSSGEPIFKLKRVIKKILGEKSLLMKDIKKLWRQYNNLLKLDNEVQIDHLEDKYYIHYQRLVKQRTFSINIDALDETMTDNFTENLQRKTNRKLSKYLEFEQKETSRGLVFARGIFAKYYSPIIYEEVYVPPSSILHKKKGRFGNQVLDEASTYINLIPKSHLIFLLHGYMG